jgi:hypothetical protein
MADFLGSQMNADWYYENNGTRHGPITGAALKQLADAGAVLPDTRVWRQGMPQWAPAKAVKGLFTTPAPASVPVPAPPQPATFRFSDPDWHPFQIVVELAKRYCPSDLPATISGIAGKTGVYALYAAAAILLLGGTIVAIKGSNLRSLAIAAALSFLLLVAQYVAQRLLGACDLAIRANRSVLSSLAVPNCAFVACTACTITGTLALWWTAAETGMISLFLGGVAVLAVGAFAALVAIQPEGISVHVSPDCRVGEEAVGTLTFLLKLFLRCAPIAFAAAVVFSTFDAASVVMGLLRGTLGEGFEVFARITRALSAIFAAALIPLAAYLTMLLYYLTLDVISAIVSIPAKLDVIGNGGGASAPKNP